LEDYHQRARNLHLKPEPVSTHLNLNLNPGAARNVVGIRAARSPAT
jgi:hypothetical protein